MRLSLSLSSSPALHGFLLAGIFSGAFAPAVRAAEVLRADPGGLTAADIVGNLAALGDLSSFTATDRSASGPVTPSSVRPSLVRQSQPARDRSLTYRSSDLFSLSKSAVPLLVADLEPRQASVARPMSGRSVGARPAAAWTRSVPGSTSFLSEEVAPAPALRW
jgi:hypothetical protein